MEEGLETASHEHTFTAICCSCECLDLMPQGETPNMADFVDFCGTQTSSVCICRHYSSNLCVTQTLFHRASYRQLSCYLFTFFVLGIFSILFQVKHYGNPTFWDHFCKEYPSYKSNIASLKAQ